VKGPAESRKICSAEVEKNSEENSENKRCYANTLTTPLKDAVERAMRGVRGVITPSLILGRGYPLTVEAERLVQHERIVLCPRCHSDASTFGSSQTIGEAGA
jgi:hypothetical protein